MSYAVPGHERLNIRQDIELLQPLIRGRLWTSKNPTAIVRYIRPSWKTGVRICNAWSHVRRDGHACGR